MPSKTPALIGAGFALLAFVFVGLDASITFGRYAGLLLAKGIFGSPLQGALLEDLLVKFGAAMGAVGVSGLFAVTGASAGTAVGAVFGVFRTRPEALEDAPAESPAPAPEATGATPEPAPGATPEPATGATSPVPDAANDAPAQPADAPDKAA